MKRSLVSALVFSVVTRAVAVHAQPTPVVWDGNGVSPEMMRRLTCKHVGIGARILGNPITGESSTTAERFFMVQKRALECLPGAVIEARRLIRAHAATLDPTAVARALALQEAGAAEIYTQLKKHLPQLSLVLTARRSRPDPELGYDIKKGHYPWTWSIGPMKRRARGPLMIAFGLNGLASFRADPRIRHGLSADTFGYLTGPDRLVGGSFREHHQGMRAGMVFFPPPGPTPEQQHEIDDMLAIGRERAQTVLCHFERTGTEPTPDSACNDPRFDAVRGRPLAAIEEEDRECRVEMAESGAPQLPPHLPPYFLGAGYRDPDALCKNVQRTLLALSVWHHGVTHGDERLAVINAIAAGYAHGVIIADRSSDFRFDLERLAGTQLMKKVLLLRHLPMPGLDAAGDCPLTVASLEVVNDQRLLDEIARNARRLSLRGEK
jgi:hypothetical protein